MPRAFRRPAILLLLPAVALAPACAGGPPPGEPGPATPEGDVAEGEGRPTPAGEAALRVARLEVRPDTVRVRVGETAAVEVVARDSAGEPVEGVEVERSLRGRAARFDSASGSIEGVEAGEATFRAVVRRPVRPRPGREAEPERVVGRARVVVEPLPVVRLEVVPPEGPVLTGIRVRVEARAFSEAGERREARIAWSSSDGSVATVNPHGLLEARAPGTATVTASSEGVEASVRVEVVASPIRSVELTAPDSAVPVGRPLRLEAAARDSAGEPVEGVPLQWTVEGPHGGTSENAYLDEAGRFVAEEPGLYYVTAAVGARSSTVELEAASDPAFRRRPMEAVGHGTVTGRPTSSLRVFRGVDGRDYAYTGTLPAGEDGGEAGAVLYAWDVTDRSEPVRTDSVAVGAGAVKDVEINETRNLAVVALAGGSDRRTGIVMLDIRVPGHPEVVARFTGDLAEGVRDVWIEGQRAYAANAGTGALHVLDLGGPANPAEVGRWQLEEGSRCLRHVTLHDGLAYLAHGDEGLVVADVGRGLEGGTPTGPVVLSRFAYRGPSGSGACGGTHRVVSHGDLVFVSDEVSGCEACVNGPRGHVRVLDVSDPRRPEEVASYRVPEAGAQDLWVQDGRLYVAYGQGGVRVVDVTGDLRGDLYRQGREIGWFVTGPVPDGAGAPEETARPRAAMARALQLYEGHVFVADMHSGLWILGFEGEGSGGGS